MTPMPQVAGRHLAVSLLLVVATLLSYGRVHSFEFVQYDDLLYVARNPMVQQGLTWDGVRWAFTATRASNWHPVTWLSHMVDWQLHGPDPGGHHVSNLALHIVNAMLLYFALHAMTGKQGRSGFVAALFALHPLHVESVAWVSERKDLLSTLFGILAIHVYVLYARKPRAVRYLCVVALFSLSLMAKPMFVTLPFLLLLLDHWPLERFSPRRPSAGDVAPPDFRPLPGRIGPTWTRLLAEKAPLVLLSVASGVVTLAVQRGALELAGNVGFGARLANVPISYVRYVAKMLWPADLSVIYTHPNLPGGTAWPWWQVSAAALLLLTITSLVVLARRRRYLVVGWLWYLGTLVPVIGFVQVGVHAIADRYTYFPLVGLFVAIAWGGHDLLSSFRPKNAKVAVSCALVILADCSLRTREQVRSWSDSVTLFRRSLEACPTNPYLRVNLGAALLSRGRRAEAIDQFRRVLEVHPESVAAHDNLAREYGMRGDYEGMREHAQALVRLRPDDPHANARLGVALSRLGDGEGATSFLRTAVRLNPSHPFARYELAQALASQGLVAEAVEELRTVVEEQPRRLAARVRLAELLASQGNVEDAVRQLREALRVDPDQPEARELLRQWTLSGEPGDGDRVRGVPPEPPRDRPR